MTLGVREMARQLDCAPSLVSRYKGRGMPMVTPATARAWMRDNVARDPRSSLADGGAADQPENPARVADYQASRARREQAEAELAELKLQRERGEVLDQAQALQAIYTAFRQLRDSSMLMGRKLAPTLASMTDVREIRLLLERSQAEVLEAFVQRTLQSLVDGLNRAPLQTPDDLLAFTEVQP